MNTPISNMFNRRNEKVGSILFDADAQSWSIRVDDEASCRGGFRTQKEAFDWWHSHYDRETGKLK